MRRAILILALVLFLTLPGCSTMTQAALAKVTDYAVTQMDKHNELVEQKTEAVMSTTANTLAQAVETKTAQFDANLGRIAGEITAKVADGAMEKVGTGLTDWAARQQSKIDAKDEKSNWDKLMYAVLGLGGAVGGGMTVAKTKRTALKQGAVLMAANPANGGLEKAKEL